MAKKTSVISKKCELVPPEKRIPKMVKETSVISHVCDKESGVRNFVSNDFQEYGSGFVAAAKQASFVKEKEAKAQLEAKSAELRGNKAIAEEWWLSQHKIEDQIDLLKSRKYALELEKQRAAGMASLPPPRTNLAEKFIIQEKSENGCTTETKLLFHSGPIVQKSSFSETMNACEQAAVVSELQKKNEEKQTELLAKRNADATERFEKALNRQRLEKEYAATMQMIQKAEKLYHQQNAQQASQVPTDRITMCPPVDKLIRKERQQKLEQGFQKVIKNDKEHAIEDLEGYTDHLEEKFSARKVFKPKNGSVTSIPSYSSLLRSESFEERYYSSREKSSDDVAVGDMLNMAYIESSPILDHLSPVTSSSPKVNIQPTKRDQSVQVDENMFPVTKCIQVDLLSRTDSSISSPQVDEVDRHRRSVSIGIQTDSIWIVQEPVMVSGSMISSSSYKSLPPKHGMPLFPDIFLSQIKSTTLDPETSEDYISSSVSENPSLNRPSQKYDRVAKRSPSKQSKYFPSIFSQAAATSPKLYEHIKQLVEKYDMTPQNSHTVRVPTIPVQAIPLSEPIREPSTPTRRVSSTLKSTLETAEASFTNSNIDALNNLRKTIYDHLQETPNPSLGGHVSNEESLREYLSSTRTKQLMDNKFEQGTKNVKSSESSLTVPLNGSSNTSDVLQSFYDIRKEELPNVSTLVNLSDVEITQISQTKLDDSKEQASEIAPEISASEGDVLDSSLLPDTTNNARSAINIENLNMIRRILRNQLRRMPAVSEEPSSFQFDPDSIGTKKIKQQVCWLQNGVPFVYHELSTIQEMDSALADITHKSFEEDKIKTDCLRAFRESIRKSEREEIDSTPSSLVTEVSDLGHVLESFKIIPQVPTDKEVSKDKDTKLPPELSKKPTVEKSPNGLPINNKKYADRPTASPSITSSYAQSPDTDTEWTTSPASETQIEPMSIVSAVVPSSSSPKSPRREPLKSYRKQAKSVHSPDSEKSRYSAEYDRILKTMMKNFLLVPPAAINASSNSQNLREKKVVPSERTDDKNSDASSINIDLDEGSLTIKDFNSTQPSTAITFLSNFSTSVSASESTKPKQISPLPQTPVQEANFSPNIHSFQPLTPIYDTSSRLSSLKDDLQRESKQFFQSADTISEKTLRISPSKQDKHICNSESSFVPLSYITGSSKRDESSGLDKLTPTAAAFVGSERSVVKNPRAHFAVSAEGFSSSEFQPLSVYEGSLPTSSSLDTLLQKFGDRNTLKKDAFSPQSDVLPTSLMTPTNLHRLHKSSTAYDSQAFEPLTPLDTSALLANNWQETKPDPTSSSSSNASESCKTVLHKAVTRARKKMSHSGQKSPLARCITPTGFSSGSDESLSHMFTGSKIIHQSTPIKSPGKVSQEERQTEDDDVTLSKSGTSCASIEKARCLKSNKFVNGRKQASAEAERNVVETLVKTESTVSVVIQNCQSSPVAETVMSQSMVSFLQHEMSTAITSDEHVSLLSVENLAPSHCSNINATSSSRQQQQHTPKTPLSGLETLAWTSVSCAKTPGQTSLSCPPSTSRGITPSSGSSGRSTPRTEYKKRTKRLWNNLEEVKAKQQIELRKKAFAQNREKVKELEMKLQRKRKTSKRK